VLLDAVNDLLLLSHARGTRGACPVVTNPSGRAGLQNMNWTDHIRIAWQTAAIAAGLVIFSAAWNWIEGRWQR
jgi:hypothetical protein